MAQCETHPTTRSVQQLTLSCVRVANNAHNVVMTLYVLILFNDFNLKIMKLTLYAVQKINYPSCLYMLLADRSCGD